MAWPAPGGGFWPATVTGRSLAPVLSGGAAEVYDEIFGYFTDTQRMVRGSDGWKLIWYPAIQRTQLFHVNDDPEERHDRSAEPAQATRLARLRATLAGWQRANGDAALLATTAEARP